MSFKEDLQKVIADIINVRTAAIFSKLTWLDIKGKPKVFPPENHKHSTAEVNGLVGELARKEDRANLGELAYKNSVKFAELMNTPTAYTPDKHRHPAADIDGLSQAVEGVAREEDLLRAFDRALVKVNRQSEGKPDYDEVLKSLLQLKNNLEDYRNSVEKKFSKLIYIVETGNNKQGWWRKWSDGWIEQGGEVPFTGNSWQTATITFPKEFKDLSFHWHALASWHDSSFAANTRYNEKDSKTTTGLKVYSVWSSDKRVKENHLATWYACGWSK